MDSNIKFIKGIFLLLFFFAFVLACVLFKVMDSFFKPVILSILLSFVFYPPIKKLKTKLKMPWWLSTTIIFLIFFIVFFLIVNLLTVSFKSIASALPRYERKFFMIMEALKLKLSENSGSRLYAILGFDTDISIFSNIENQFNVLKYLRNLALDFTTSVVTFMKTLFLVVLMSGFLLSEFRKMKQKVSLAFDDEHNSRVLRVVQNIIADVTHYASIKFVISFFTGLLIFFACSLTKMDFPLIWGFIAFCLNFIPTFGSIVSCSVTMIFAFIQFYPSLLPAIFISIWVIVVNFVLGNILEPKIEGDNLGISPFVILVALSLAGWLWGILGMIIAVPLMVITKIVCENISYLKPIGILIGSKAK
ncbi:AI-2E family transporter [Treponema pectinovorum]|uniref:AI-2E family transporter n=1 Tax=Treponema pectinovorum TaxID=164 RepID=UPI003D929B87